MATNKEQASVQYQKVDEAPIKVKGNMFEGLFKSWHSGGFHVKEKARGDGLILAGYIAKNDGNDIGIAIVKHNKDYKTFMYDYNKELDESTQIVEQTTLMQKKLWGLLRAEEHQKVREHLKEMYGDMFLSSGYIMRGVAYADSVLQKQYQGVQEIEEISFLIKSEPKIDRIEAESIRALLIEAHREILIPMVSQSEQQTMNETLGVTKAKNNKDSYKRKVKAHKNLVPYSTKHKNEVKKRYDVKKVKRGCTETTLRPLIQRTQKDYRKMHRKTR